MTTDPRPLSPEEDERYTIGVTVRTGRWFVLDRHVDESTGPTYPSRAEAIAAMEAAESAREEAP